jgi:hypothetical protein
LRWLDITQNSLSRWKYARLLEKIRITNVLLWNKDLIKLLLECLLRSLRSKLFWSVSSIYFFTFQNEQSEVQSAAENCVP